MKKRKKVKKLSKEEVARMIAKSIRLAYDSLDSHLGYTYGDVYQKDETHRFHMKCVEEYAEIIYTLSRLYKK